MQKKFKHMRIFIRLILHTMIYSNTIVHSFLLSIFSYKRIQTDHDYSAKFNCKNVYKKWIFTETFNWFYLNRLRFANYCCMSVSVCVLDY